MASVRILHASDLHIAAVENITSPADRFTPGTIKDAALNRMLASSYDSSILLHLAKFAHQQAELGRLDAILLTGDIATTGSSEDLRKAYEFIHAPVDPDFGWQTAAGDARLGDVNSFVWLLPGNHDRFRARAYGYAPGGKAFDLVFSDDWKGPVQAYEFLRKPGLTVSVIAADFNLHTSDDADRWFGSLAQGKVYDEILDELEQKTKQLPDAARQCVIWAVHFPPAFPRVSPYLQLLEGDRLISRANSCGIKALLAGHTHDAVRYRRPDMTFDVFCAGTASQAFSPEGNHFRILEISADDAGTVLVSSEEYRFNNVRGGIITSRSGFRRV